MKFEGKTFIQGLHGVPASYQGKKGMDIPADWWWAKGTIKEDNEFLYKTAIEEITKYPPPHYNK